jgi:hypothetical protein
MTHPNPWLPVTTTLPPKTMAEMLYDAAAGLSQTTQGKLDFYVDALGVAPDRLGPATSIRYNCYIRVVSKAYLHLLFQVTTPAGGPFPAKFGTPEGDPYPEAKSVSELNDIIVQILRRQETQDIVAYLTRIAIP